ncbi:hypothetical protein BU25DRAFT_493076 [Macroventuria anomochaeta]|uniref:Uncharacterized protein n=1 Tax=Macroventuria anomochaeta TaxID=301207 RepID=A0ACB6RUX0_9PLEO|nr:uncharacterized protein BU25DRAFT_493076 [Macroventuria anomochaeta]KAF2625077.1 hypothetical protein BU25DRAFT_493076 [Macroventuria anomochaeta]
MKKQFESWKKSLKHTFGRKERREVLAELKQAKENEQQQQQQAHPKPLTDAEIIQCYAREAKAQAQRDAAAKDAREREAYCDRPFRPTSTTSAHKTQTRKLEDVEGIDHWKASVSPLSLPAPVMGAQNLPTPAAQEEYERVSEQGPHPQPQPKFKVKIRRTASVRRIAMVGSRRMRLGQARTIVYGELDGLNRLPLRGRGELDQVRVGDMDERERWEFNRGLRNWESVSTLNSEGVGGGAVRSFAGLLQSRQGGEVGATPDLTQSVEDLSSVDTPRGVQEHGKGKKWATWAGTMRKRVVKMCCGQQIGSVSPPPPPPPPPPQISVSIPTYSGDDEEQGNSPGQQHGAENLQPASSRAGIPSGREPAQEQRTTIVHEAEGELGVVGDLLDGSAEVETGEELCPCPEGNGDLEGAEDFQARSPRAPKGDGEAGPGSHTAAFRAQRLEETREIESAEYAEYLQNDTGTVLRVRSRPRRQRTGAGRLEWRQNLQDKLARVSQPGLVEKEDNRPEEQEQTTIIAHVAALGSLEDLPADTQPPQTQEAEVATSVHEIPSVLPDAAEDLPASTEPSQKRDETEAPRDTGGLRPNEWLRNTTLQITTLQDFTQAESESEEVVTASTGSQSGNPQPAMSTRPIEKEDPDPVLEDLQLRARNVSLRLRHSLRLRQASVSPDGPSVLGEAVDALTISPAQAGLSRNRLPVRSRREDKDESRAPSASRSEMVEGSLNTSSPQDSSSLPDAKPAQADARTERASVEMVIYCGED